MKRGKAPTLEDIARQAGVSAMSASVVLNGARSSTRVSLDTRTRIIEAAEELGYRANQVARSLSRRRMDTIGIVAVIESDEINVYFLEVLNGLLEAIARCGQNATIFSIQKWEQDENRVLQFCDGRIDGVILLAPNPSQKFVASMPQHTPFVSIHSDNFVSRIKNIEADNEGGAYSMVQYLISKGHRRIMHITGGEDRVGARERVQGYLRALREAGIPEDPSLTIAGYFHARVGRETIHRLIENRHRIPLPTAIFCASDMIALGCLEALTAHGVRVPEDISIAGFDDNIMARMSVPPLTTVRQPFRKMGHWAVETLLQQIQGEAPLYYTEGEADSPTAFTDRFPAELIIRESVGVAPHAEAFAVR